LKWLFNQKLHASNQWQDVPTLRTVSPPSLETIFNLYIQRNECGHWWMANRNGREKFPKPTGSLPWTIQWL